VTKKDFLRTCQNLKLCIIAFLVIARRVATWQSIRNYRQFEIASHSFAMTLRYYPNVSNHIQRTAYSFTVHFEEDIRGHNPIYLYQIGIVSQKNASVEMTNNGSCAKLSLKTYV